MLIMYSQKLYRASTVSVSLASTSLLVPAQNALRIVRKYVLEFFQPLAAPQPNPPRSPGVTVVLNGSRATPSPRLVHFGSFRVSAHECAFVHNLAQP